MNCKNCGAILNSDDLFCKQCGQSVNNESNNMSNNQKIQSSNMNSYANNNEQNYQQYNNYNNYNNTSNTGNAGKIILIIVLAIVFWVVGWFLGKVLFEEKDTSTNLNSTSSITNSSSNKDNDKNTNNSNSNITTSKNSSYIVTESGKKVYFEVASSLKEDIEYSKDDDRWFEKTVGDDDLLITVTEDYATMEEYMTDLEDTANRRKSNPEYNNVQLSEIKTKTVNGKEFKIRTLDYNMEDTKFRDLYIVYEIEEESLYSIEVEEYQLLTDKELNGLLNISIVK